MDGSTPAPMMFASEVGHRFKGAISRNSLLTVNMIAFYLGLFSASAFLVGVAMSVASLLASVAASGPLGELAELGSGGVSGKLAMAGIFGVFSSLLGAYGLASARGLLVRRAWARGPAMIASIIWAVLTFFLLFIADKISGALLLMLLLQVGIWAACSFVLSLPSVKESFAEE
jgi:hypothetical protein